MRWEIQRGKDGKMGRGQPQEVKPGTNLDLQKNGDIAFFTFRPILNMDIRYSTGCAGGSQAIRSHYLLCAVGFHQKKKDVDRQAFS